MFFCGTFLAKELICFKNNIKIHHIVPFAGEGSNEKSNIALIHNSCYQEYST